MDGGINPFVAVAGLWKNTRVGGSSAGDVDGNSVGRKRRRRWYRCCRQLELRKETKRECSRNITLTLFN